MLGTYLLVFIGPGSAVIASLLGLPSVEALGLVAGVFGGVVAAVILFLGRISGAHINPAITLSNAAAGFDKRGFTLPYIGFQIAWGLLAGLCLKLVFGTLVPSISLGSTKLGLGISPTEGIGLEIAGTFVLAMSALTAISFLRSAVKQAFLVGGTLFVLIMLIGPLTGGSFNPVRSLGPSLFSGYFDNQLVYYVGPLIGGACAGLTFRLVRNRHGGRNGDLNPVRVC